MNDDTTSTRISPIEGRELYLFPTAAAARYAGFTGHGRQHREFPNLWGLSLEDDEPDRARGLGPFSRVYITEGTFRHAYHNDRMRARLAEVQHHARAMLRTAPALWMEF